MPPDIPADLEAALAERYELRRTLGRGGMATVYLAGDRKHRREVAIKVLLPGLSAVIGAERFLKEIEIAARLTHPHILALHDSGEAAGFLYYVMPYIDGGSLRQLLERERRLDAGRALAIAAPVADALAYAHRMGIFHRDIKPENILFSQGHPIVADFGIAKAISTAGGANLTRTGFPLGTPGYMSPEQAAGLTDLDERTDVYSLAVVIYEMLVGEIPGRWPTEDAVRAGRFLEAPPSHRSRLAGAGASMEGALVRGLAIRHDQRTPTPGALIGQLTGAAPPPPPPRRRYSDDEVREIVDRAAELEVSSPTASGSMTIGGVEALAAEVGIAPKLVHAAAGALSPVSAGGAGAIEPALQGTKRSWIAGGPTKLFYERVVEGEVPESEYAVLIDELRRELGHAGMVSVLGRSVTWTSTRSPGIRRDLEVTISVRNGRTRITVQESLAQLVGACYGGIMGGLGGGGMGPIFGILFGALGVHQAAVAVVAPAWLLTCFSVARSSYFYAARRRERELLRLVDRLAQLARDLVPERLAPRESAPRLPGARGRG